MPVKWHQDLDQSLPPLHVIDIMDGPKTDRVRKLLRFQLSHGPVKKSEWRIKNGISKSTLESALDTMDDVW